MHSLKVPHKPWWKFWRSGPSVRSPEAIVRSYIADFYKWNNEAIARTPNELSAGAMEINKQQYAKIIAKHCRPGHQYQPIAYGSDSVHAPDAEVILTVDTLGNRSTVRTRHTRALLYGGTFVAEYEYHLVFDGGRWFLESALYVDADGKYEGL
jgi:hypothetical protein